MRSPTIKAPTGRQPRELQPMPWGRAIVGRPTNCSRPGRGAVWTFTIREAP